MLCEDAQEFVYAIRRMLFQCTRFEKIRQSHFSATLPCFRFQYQRPDRSDLQYLLIQKLLDFLFDDNIQ